MCESLPSPLEMHPVLPVKPRLGRRASHRRRPPGPPAVASGVAEWTKKKKAGGNLAGFLSRESPGRSARTRRDTEPAL